MKVWINRSLKGDVLTWRVVSNRTLLLFNNTGRFGKCFEQVYLSYKRNGRKHVLSINRVHARKHVEKTVGIWLSLTDYEVVTTGEICKSSYGNKIDGRFGIYNVGTVIVCEGYTWELKENKGWVIKDKPKFKTGRRRIVNGTLD